MSSDRLLKPKSLPDTLWRTGQGLLCLPSSLCRAYMALLNDKGLLADATCDGDDDGPVGGMTEEETRKHFAQRFAASSARVQLAALDPKADLKSASDLFVKAFSGGTIGLLDIPCGAGAASAALLGCVAELRKARVLPREPLNVFLVAGDISEHARGYARDLLASMRPDLEHEGIWVHDTYVPWDVLDPESTTNVLDRWLEHAHGCREYFVVMANFSGFLQRGGKLRAAQNQLDEVIRWAAQRRSSVAWIEPQTNEASLNFLPRLIRWFKHLPSLFSESWEPSTSIRATNARYTHPVKGSTPPVRLNLIRLEATEP